MKPIEAIENKPEGITFEYEDMSGNVLEMKVSTMILEPHLLVSLNHGGAVHLNTQQALLMSFKLQEFAKTGKL